MKQSRTLALTALIAAGMLAQGCAKKKVAAAAPPPVPSSVSNPARTSSPAVARQTPASQPSPGAATATERRPDAATRKRIDELLAKIDDAYFDYNAHSLRPDAIQALQKDSAELRDILRDYPHYNLTIEGYCDDRGSAEYNVALGDARAKAAKEYLVGIGIPDGQLGVLSYGKEKQLCQDQTESCWQKNRRIHIVAAAR
jgi:peptidoglycan-associated lipoprotein